MNNGFGFMQAIMLLNRPSIAIIIKEIKEHLEQGEQAETFIANYFPKSIRSLFAFHLRFLSFEKALSISLDNLQFTKSLKDKLVKTLFYPLLLSLLSWLGMACFAIFLIPVLSTSLRGLGGDIAWMSGMRALILLLFNCSLLFVAFLLIGVFYFKNNRRQVYGFILLSKFKKNNLLEEISSYQFIHYLCLCLQNGCSSLQSIALIREQKFYPLLSFICYHLHQDFLAGKEVTEIINNPFLDEGLSYFFQIAMHSNEVSKTLLSYCNFKEEKWNHELKKITILLQLFSYGLISIIVISIYQVLLAPLQILSNL